MTAPDPPAGRDRGDVLSSLPRTRPQRRSSKRDDAPAGSGKPAAPRRAGSASAANPPGRKRTTARSTAGPARPAGRAKPVGVRPSAATQKARAVTEPVPRQPRPPTGVELAGTAVAAAGELAQLGLSLGTRALRKVAARVPRP